MAEREKPSPESPEPPIAMREQGWVPMFYYQAVRLGDLALTREQQEAVRASTAASITSTYTRVQEQLDSIRSRMDEALKDRDERIALALENTREQMTSSRLALEERLKLLNEFRAQSEDQSHKFAQREYVDSMIADLARQAAGAVPREAYEARTSAIEKSLTVAAERLQRIEGGAAGSARTMTAILAVGSFLVAAGAIIVTLFMRGG